jgi:hypothetical protein
MKFKDMSNKLELTLLDLVSVGLGAGVGYHDSKGMPIEPAARKVLFLTFPNLADIIIRSMAYSGFKEVHTKSELAEKNFSFVKYAAEGGAKTAAKTGLGYVLGYYLGKLV